MTDGFAVRIHDGTSKDPTAQLPAGSAGFLAFDLAQILAAIGDAAFRLNWTCADVDCFGAELRSSLRSLNPANKYRAMSCFKSPEP